MANADDSGQQTSSGGFSGATADALGLVMLAAFVTTAGCALICIGLSWWQAIVRQRREANAVVVMVQSPRTVAAVQAATAAAAAKTAAEEQATVWDEKFKVRRITSTVFRVEELQPGVPSPSDPAAAGNAVPSPPEEQAEPVSACPSNASSEEVCEVCCEAPPEVVFLPCSHGGVCRSCAEQIVKRSNRHCHTCRSSINKVVLVEAEDMETLLAGGIASGHRML